MFTVRSEILLFNADRPMCAAPEVRITIRHMEQSYRYEVDYDNYLDKRKNLLFPKEIIFEDIRKEIPKTIFRH